MINYLKTYITTLLFTLTLVYEGNAVQDISKNLQIENFQFDWSVKTQYLSNDLLLIAQQQRSSYQYYEIEILIYDLFLNQVVNRIQIADDEVSYSRPEIVYFSNTVYIVYIKQYGNRIDTNLKKFNTKLEELDVEQNLGSNLFEALTNQNRQYILLQILNENTIGIAWLSYSDNYLNKQWNVRTINQQTMSDLIILPDGEKITMAQNYLGILSTVVMKDELFTFSSFKDGKLKAQYTSPNNQNDQIKLQLLQNNGFVLTILYGTSVKIYKFNKYFQYLGDQSRFSLQSGDQKFIQFQNNKLICFSYNNYELNEYVQIIDIYEKKNQYDEIETSQLLKIKNLNFKNLHQLKIEYIEQHKYLLMWITNNYYHYELNIQKIDLGIQLNECQQNCIKCSKNQQCIMCQDGYSLDTINNECLLQCVDNCKVCSNPNYCDECQSGYLQTIEALCVQQQNPNYLKLNLNNENPGKQRMIVVDDEIIVIYMININQPYQLKILKLSIQGIIIQQQIIDKIDKQIIDYDIEKGLADDTTFIISLKMKITDNTANIYYYEYNYNSLTLEIENLLVENCAIFSDDQIKLLTFRKQVIFIFYLSKQDQQILINSLMYDKLTTKIQSYTLSYITWKYTIYIELINTYYYLVIQDQSGQQCTLNIQLTNYHYILCDSSVFIYSPQLNKRIRQNKNYKLYIHFDDRMNQQLYLEFTQNSQTQTIQITQTTRNITQHSYAQIGQLYMIIIWQGQLTKESQTAQGNSIYMNLVSLQNLQLLNTNKKICGLGCLVCTDSGQCQECKNSNYNLINGKCQLICPNNCQVCNDELKCLQCKINYFLNSLDECTENQLGQTLALENRIFSSLYYYENTIQMVYLQKNITKYEVMFEEFDRQGRSISGEVRISDDTDYSIVLQNPKVIKTKFNIIINYVLLDKELKYFTKLVILNLQYQLAQDQLIYSIIGQTLVDFYIANNMFYFYYLDYYSQQQYRLYQKQFQFNLDYLTLFKDYSFYCRFPLPMENLKVTQTNNYFFIKFKYQDQNKYYFVFYDFDYRFINEFDKEYEPIFYKNEINYLSVQVNQISSNNYNIQFLDSNSIIVQSQVLNSNGVISFLNIKRFNSQLLIIYVEQFIDLSTSKIQLNIYNEDGLLLNSKTVQSNEFYINSFDVEVNDEFIYLTWSSIERQISYIKRLNKLFESISFNQEICSNNCDKCNSQFFCDSCMPNYQLNQNYECQPICSSNCQQCSKPNTCDYCLGNFKFIDNQCQNITQKILEIPICQEPCYGLGSMITYDDSTILFTYQQLLNNQYSIESKKFTSESTTVSQQQLIQQVDNIQYHKSYQYIKDNFIIFWLSGNCEVQCKMFIKLYSKTLSIVQAQKEIRVLKVLDVVKFDLQIKSYSTDVLLTWTEQDENNKDNSYLGIYKVSTNEFTVQYNINQNTDDISIQPHLVTFTSSYVIAYIKNSNIINAIITSGTTKTYQEMYKTVNIIESFDIQYLDSSTVVVFWIEIDKSNQFIPKYYIYSNKFDIQMLQKQVFRRIVFQYNQISNIKVLQYSQYYVFYQQMEQQIIKLMQIQVQDSVFYYSQSKTLDGNQVNILSEFLVNTNYFIHQITIYYTYQYILFQGQINGKKQLFFKQNQNSYLYQDNCDSKCFYCNTDNICAICQYGYYLKSNKCVLQLPNNCIQASSINYCQTCQNGYKVVSGQCELSDLKFGEMKITQDQSMNDQRISVFSNGDFISVWTNYYYKNEGTSIFMNLYSVTGQKLKEDTRITLTANGIFTNPNVLTFSNDEFIVVWIEGDHAVNSKIKMQRFTKNFERKNSEILVLDNYCVNYKLDRLISLQPINNGYIIFIKELYIVDTVSYKQSYQQIVRIYDLNDQFIEKKILTQEFEIKPIVQYNSLIKVFVWQSYFPQLNAKIFNINNEFQESIILSEKGQNPSLISLSDGSFIIAWQEITVNNLNFMSQNIIYKKFASDFKTLIYSYQIIISEENLSQPYVQLVTNGFAIIFLSQPSFSDANRFVKMQYFTNDGLPKGDVFTVFVSQKVPSNPVLYKLPSGEILATWLHLDNQDSQIYDIYFKRYNGDGTQISLDTLICSDNCQYCTKNSECTVCGNNYKLVGVYCYQEIENCVTYLDSTTLLECTQCAQSYQLINNICVKIDSSLNELQVEYISDISHSFSQISFTNGDIYFFWVDNFMAMSQKFNSTGYKIGEPKILIDIGRYSDSQEYYLSALNIGEDYYVVAIHTNYSKEIQIYGFNQTDSQICSQSISNFYYYNDIKTKMYQQYCNQMVQMRYLENRVFAVFYMDYDYYSKNLQWKMKINTALQESYYAIYIKERITVIIFDDPSNSGLPDFQIQIIDKQIKIIFQSPSDNYYYVKNYDFQGQLISIKRIQTEFYLKKNQIMFINDDTYITAYNMIQGNQYDIFYNVYKFGKLEMSQNQVKVSDSQEVYKLDIQLFDTQGNIVIVWREGSSKIEQNLNSRYKAKMISKLTLKQNGGVITLSYNVLFRQKQYSLLNLLELYNSDILIALMNYNPSVSTYGIFAVKINQNGQKIPFSHNSCKTGCQECSKTGDCLKCINEDNQILTLQGTCIPKQNCKNFKQYCNDCLDGYYYTPYKTCELITDIVEKEIQFSYPNTYLYFIRSVYYKTGEFVIAYIKNDLNLKINKYKSDGTVVFLDKLLMSFSSLSQYMMSDLNLIINNKNELIVIGVYDRLFEGNKYALYFYKFDTDYNKIDISLTVNTPTYYSYEFQLFAQILSNNNIAITMKTSYETQVVIIDQDFKILSNFLIEKSLYWVDSIFDGNYYYFSISKDKQSVIKIYDNTFRFIKDLIVYETGPAYLEQINSNVILVITQNQFVHIKDRIIVNTYSLYTNKFQMIQTLVTQELQIMILSKSTLNTYHIQLYNQEGIVKYTKQANMKLLTGKYIVQLFLMQNNEYAVQFIFGNYEYSQKVSISRITQEALSVSVDQIVCPQNCQQCESTTVCNTCLFGYNLNQQTGICEKVCTVLGCNVCQYSDCDSCNQGLVLNQNGQCEEIVIVDPPVDNYHTQIAEKCSVIMMQKVIRLPNDDYVIIFVCEGIFRVRRFNTNGLEISFIEVNIDPIHLFDATNVSDEIIIIIVFVINKKQSITYSVDPINKQLNNKYEQIHQEEINELRIKSLGDNYVKLISVNQQFLVNQIEMTCLSQSFYIFNKQDSIQTEKQNFNNPDTLTEQDCNKNQFKDIQISNNEINILTVNKDQVTLKNYNQLGIFINDQNFEIPDVKDIKFQVNTQAIAFIYNKFSDSKWNLRMYNRLMIIIIVIDQYITSDADFDFVMTDQSLITSWTNTNSLNYDVFNFNGDKVTSGALTNTQPTSKPVLVVLMEIYVAFSWQQSTSNGWAISTSILNQQGQSLDLTKPICSNYCSNCNSSIYCTDCIAGYVLQYNSVEKRQFCSKQCENTCEECSLGKCYRCQTNYSVKNYECVLDKVQETAILINEYTQFSQTKPYGAMFSDGSLILAWMSNFEDGSSWGIYAQIVDNLGQKVGSNVQINQNSAGSQHSPYIATLKDDSAVIIFLEGDPIIGAKVKGIKFNKNLEKIGEEFMIGNSITSRYDFSGNNICKVQALGNGGFVTVHITDPCELTLQFYDSSGSLVQTQKLFACFEFWIEYYINIATTNNIFSIVYQDGYWKYWVNQYTFDGQLIQTKKLEVVTSFNVFCLILSSNSELYGVSFQVWIDNKRQIYFQWFDSQFNPYGTYLLIDEFQFQQNSYYQQVTFFDLAQYKTGMNLMINVIIDNIPIQFQYFISDGWQVTLINQLHVKQDVDFFFLKYVLIIPSKLDYYFIIWIQFQKQNIQDSSNILMQRFDQTGQYLTATQIYCPINCKVCSDQSTCTQCVAQYKVNLDKQCSAICETNCLTCTVPTICDFCQTGFYQKQEGKCVPIPQDYYQPLVITTLSINIIILDFTLNENLSGTFKSMESVNGKQICNFYTITNNIFQLTQTIELDGSLSQYQVRTFQFDQIIIFIVYMDYGIKVIKIDEFQNVILNSNLLLDSYADFVIYPWNVIVKPLIDGTFSVIYYNYIITAQFYNLILDSNLNKVENNILYEIDNNKFITREKESFIIDSELNKIEISFEGKKENKLIKSDLLGISSSQIYVLQNGNKIQILESKSKLTSGQKIYYRILNVNDEPITLESEVIQNGFLQQSFFKILIFQNNFIIFVEQLNFNNLNNYFELFSINFENSGMKASEPKFICSYKIKVTFVFVQLTDGFKIYQDSHQVDGTAIQYMQFDTNGNQLTWNTEVICISNCAQCKNDQYCDVCKQNYQLDTNNQCILQCQQNCLTCSTESTCDTCISNYHLSNSQCVQNDCGLNCQQCQLDYKQEIVCFQCQDGYQFNVNTKQCQPICPNGCNSCTQPYKCDVCLSGFIITDTQQCQFENLEVIDNIKNTQLSTPTMYTFPDGSYVMLWYQNGDDPGVFCQIYSILNKKIGPVIKISSQARRLLTESQIKQEFYATIVGIYSNFYVLWIDNTQLDQSQVQFKKFDQLGQPALDTLNIASIPQLQLSQINQPCYSYVTQYNNIFTSYLAQDELGQYNLQFQIFDSDLNMVSEQKQIKAVNQLTAPKVSEDSNGILTISYSSRGYQFVQKITQLGDFLGEAIALTDDDNSLNLKSATLKNGFVVFLWEIKTFKTPMVYYILNYQLISIDTQTRSEIKSIDTTQNATLNADIISFNEGFIITWITTNSYYKTEEIQFQLFDSLGIKLNEIQTMSIQGKYPKNPRISVIDDTYKFAITCVAKILDQNGSIQGDGIFIKYFNQNGNLISDTQPQLELCSNNCQTCQSPKACYQCQPGYYLNDSNNCQVDCGAFCQSCEESFACKQCSIGYQLTNEKQCIFQNCPSGYTMNDKLKQCEPICAEGCSGCSSPNTCSECREGYVLTSQICLKNSQPTDQSIILIIIICVLGFFVLILLFCFYQLRQKLQILPNINIDENCPQGQVENLHMQKQTEVNDQTRQIESNNERRYLDSEIPKL